MKRKIVKPFDLEAAKNGAKIETRNGKEVEILRWDLNNKCSILGIVTEDDGYESFVGWENDGTNPFKMDIDNDLVIVEYEDEESEYKKMKKIIKPFDLEAAKNGVKVETRDGNKAEILKWDANSECPLIGVYADGEGYEHAGSWTLNGKWGSIASPLDLVIVEYEDKSDWKPTDEQIEAIRCARSFVVDDFGEHQTLSEILMQLEEQLRKIKEEL